MLEELEKINKKVKSSVKSSNLKYYYGRFLPSTDFMFVAERPTVPKNSNDWDPTNNFYLSNSDINFVNLLNKYGLGGSYITDIVKSCGPSGDKLSKKDVDLYFPLLLEEIKVLKPKIIVAMSQKAESILVDKFIIHKIKIPIVRVFHPSYVQRYGKRQEYEKQIQNLTHQTN